MITVKKLARKINAEVEGDETAKIAGIRPLNAIAEDCVVYLEKQKDSPLLENKKPAAVICSSATKLEDETITLLKCKNPRLAFALAMRFFYPPEEVDGGVHHSAVIEDGAVVSPSASIEANCCVGAGSSVGDNTVVMPGCVIGRNVTIGGNCILHPNVSVLDRCVLGKRVILHSGVVIGSDGFGYVQDEGIHLKVPQVGNAVIGDDVEIGANSAVDRATMGSTRIGRGTKIDNLVQVGHNTTIGEDCIICGAAGISGSCEIGDRVTLAGQVGVSDHIKIGDGAILGGKSGVIEDVPPKSFYSGFPARRHRRTMKIFSAIENLPELAEKIERLIEE